MSVAVESPSNETFDAAIALRKQFDSSLLHIRDFKADFKQKDFPGYDADQVDPIYLAADVAEQAAYLRKLKFQFVEQNAKDKYIKTIISDDPPSITSEDNERLRAENTRKKQHLKIQKQALADTYQRIRDIAPEVEEKYSRADELTSETSRLAKEILEAQLALSRLRAANPTPRLTVASAQAQLDAQTITMQTLDEEKAAVDNALEEVKDRVKDTAREVERLKVARTQAEGALAGLREDERDGRVVGLCEWLTASLELHRKLLGITNMRAVSENEIALSYVVRGKPIDVSLRFHPETRRLAEALVKGSDLDFTEVINLHLASNDAPGLIRTLLMRLRAGV